MNNQSKKNDISIVLCGAAGQGIQTVETLLTKTLKKSGYNVFATREYMSRVRGGVNSTEIRISSKPVRAFVEKIDILIPLSNEAISHLKERITTNTLILGEKKYIDSIPDLQANKVELGFDELSNEVGGSLYANIVALGSILYLLKADKTILHDLLTENFIKKGKDIVDNNIQAVNIGYESIKPLTDKIKLSYEMEQDLSIENDYIFDGTQAIGLGVIAGGCNYVCFYPMAPSTGIGTFLAQHALEFGMIVDQSEDEISVINKSLGASYAGARSFVATSGGGFSLMSEGVSLAGMTELPIVIVVGQRPGPSTGMPTRTCQEDLELVLYSGAGFFPRVIYSPGTIEDAFKLTQKAFNITQKYHVPVFILTDQYLVDSYYNLKVKALDLENLKIQKHIIQTTQDYERYRLTETGISPRGVPGFGEGLVDADSHTHDEFGNITEDANIRKRSVQKRFKKLGLLRKTAIPPEFIGNDDFKYLIVSWGSNYYIIKEALEILNNSDVAFLFFKQVYPIHKNVLEYLSKAKVKIAIEQNPTGQFAKLLENETHINMNHRILKHSGYIYSVEEIVEKLKIIIEVDDN